MKHLSVLALACVAIGLVSSCNKVNYSSGQNNANDGLNNIFSALKTPPQTFTVAAGTAQTVRCNKGTILNFYPNSFKDKDGNMITSGSIDIQITEMYTPGDMIANHASTVTADGHFLKSSGQVYIVAARNGEEVDANKYGIAFKQVGSASEIMDLYYGNVDAGGALSWIIDPNLQAGSTSGPTLYSGGSGSDTGKNGDGTQGGNGGSSGSGGNSGGSGSGSGQGGGDSVAETVNMNGGTWMYVFDTCTHLHYINSDLLPGTDTAYTLIDVVMPDGTFNNSNTQMFLILPAFNSMTQNRNGDYNSTTFTFLFGDDHSYVPIGQNFELIIMGYSSGSYYYAEETGITTAAHMTLHATMTPQPLSYILSSIHSL